jgi:AAA domain-containing protein
MARDRGKPDWHRMTPAVLKNRMLLLSQQRFNEREYGASTFLGLIASLTGILRLDNSTWPPTVEYVENQAIQGRRSKPLPEQESSAGSAPLFDGIWIREDLWRAIMDPTGVRYVWDDEHRIAREALSGDAARPLLPLVSREDLASWRADFASSHRLQLATSDLELLLRWRDHGGPAESLPRPLQRKWKAEFSQRVRERLQGWFQQHAPSAISGRLSPPAPATAPAVDATVISAPKGGATPGLDELVESCRSAGDLLGAGELIATTFASADEPVLQSAFARVIAAWASPLQFTMEAKSISDLIERVNEFHPEQIATALVNAAERVLQAHKPLPSSVNDLVFRLADPICSLYDIDPQFRPTDICMAAVTRLQAAHADLASAIASFLNTNTVTAKTASIAVVKYSHRLAPLALTSERPLLRDLDILLGPAFRKFCETCERHDGPATIRRATELREQLQRYAIAGETRRQSTLWKGVIEPVIQHLGRLLDEGTARSEASTAPDLKLATSALKLDLSQPNRQMAVSCRLLNRGQGRAVRVRLERLNVPLPIELEVLDPKLPFDLAGNAEQLVTFGVRLTAPADSLTIPLSLACTTTAGKSVAFEDVLSVTQQQGQPDWGRLLDAPPYTINPIRLREDLFGRDTILNDLLLHVASRTSTFLWGQKRVGKTSLLQVLAAELAPRGDVVVVILRMGELAALHEGQIAQRMAQRICEALSSQRRVPSEEEFGAGLSRLVPFMEKVISEHSMTKIALIIDEFDDLDPAFYTGERGKQFVKGLRSLSEEGLTFFFVGSERMEIIYGHHSADLNKWTSLSLDRISSREDCRALITKPVHGSIEYQDSAVDFVIDYCLGNPFYLHLFCFELFKRCAQERKTFVSDNDVHMVRRVLVEALGQTNFAHFWEDNPELDEREKARQSAENCLLLTCMASLGGRYDQLSDLLEAQERLRLPSSEQLSATELRQATERLRHRSVLASCGEGATAAAEVVLPIFRDWLIAHAELRVLPIWREYRERVLAEEDTGRPEVVPISEPTTFPVSEDELLAVSQRLVYCGKQKDVAEVRVWLRQFDDDNRIEIAFQLLKRLAERGYVTDGSKVRALRTAEEMILAKRRIVGRGVWRAVKGKHDNLCLTYVDSETKSGAATAREIAKSLRPGKLGPAGEIGVWMKTHATEDPIVIVLDDFAGTGRTLGTGLKALRKHVDKAILDAYLRDNRIACHVLFAFPEALDLVREENPGLEVMAANLLGDELLALADDAGIFTDEGETTFAKDMLLQIGRELTPQNPLGFGDMGALVVFHNSVPNNTLPIFWSNGTVNDRPWHPLFPRA